MVDASKRNGYLKCLFIFSSASDSSNINYQKEIQRSLSVNASELYRGSWEYDMRTGFGICYYQDGSRFLGEWKENKRHGYGLLVDKDGKKSGGKWYADNLILVTRRRNIKLPMNKAKLSEKIISAINASEQCSNKTKLAIARALSAKKIAETAKTYANLAEDDMQKARQNRMKFTLHPTLQGKSSVMFPCFYCCFCLNVAVFVVSNRGSFKNYTI